MEIGLSDCSFKTAGTGQVWPIRKLITAQVCVVLVAIKGRAHEAEVSSHNALARGLKDWNAVVSMRAEVSIAELFVMILMPEQPQNH